MEADSGELSVWTQRGRKHTVRRPSEIDPTNLRVETVLEVIFAFVALQAERGRKDVHAMKSFAGDSGAWDS